MFVSIMSRINLYLFRRRYRAWAAKRPIKEKVKELTGVSDFMVGNSGGQKTATEAVMRGLAQENPEDRRRRQSQLMEMLQQSNHRQMGPAGSLFGGLLGSLLGGR